MSASTLLTLTAVVRDLAVAITCGGLVAVAVVLPRGHVAVERALAVARAAAAIWAVAAVAYMFIAYSVIAARSPGEPTFGSEAWAFLTGIANTTIVKRLRKLLHPNSGTGSMLSYHSRLSTSRPFCT